jgi:hypothetical protein
MAMAPARTKTPLQKSFAILSLQTLISKSMTQAMFCLAFYGQGV